MALAQTAPPTENRTEEIVFPPSDLYSDEPQLETYLHLQQIIALLTSLEWWWRDRQDFFAAGNLTIYYSPQQKKSQDFRGPDFFLVRDTERKPRKSWVVWAEGGKYPNLIIEVLSDTTADTDRGTKKDIYQNIFRTPEYFWIDPDTLEFAGFVLVAGKYEPIPPNPNGWMWSQQLELFVGVYEDKLRFFTAEGNLVPTPPEAAQTAQEQAQTAQEQAQTAQEQAQTAQEQAQTAQEQAQIAQEQLERQRQREAKLAAKLRELNIDPDTL